MWLRSAGDIALYRGITHHGRTRRSAVLHTGRRLPKSQVGIATRYSAAGGTEQWVCVNWNLLCGERYAFRSTSFSQLECLATEATRVQRYPALKIGQLKSTLSISAIRRTDQIE